MNGEEVMGKVQEKVQFDQKLYNFWNNWEYFGNVYEKKRWSMIVIIFLKVPLHDIKTFWPDNINLIMSHNQFNVESTLN